MALGGSDMDMMIWAEVWAAIATDATPVSVATLERRFERAIRQDNNESSLQRMGWDTTALGQALQGLHAPPGATLGFAEFWALANIAGK